MTRRSYAFGEIASVHHPTCAPSSRLAMVEVTLPAIRGRGAQGTGSRAVRSPENLTPRSHVAPARGC